MTGETRKTWAFVFVATFALQGAHGAEPSGHKWTRFVQVEGQPEPVPAEWVATEEGKYAHSLKVPNPVPKDSGYRPTMTSKEYFEHLCRKESGEFIYKVAENVEGFLFMRPPKTPTDADFQDTYKLEDPYTERYFQLPPSDPRARATKFVNPPWYAYKFVEEPTQSGYWKSLDVKERFIRLSGYVQEKAEMILTPSDALRSRFAYTWRGLRRPNDRDHFIAGSELLVVDLETGEVYGVLRNYVRTGFTRNTRRGVWWMNAISCPGLPKPFQDNLGQQLYGFVSKVLRPSAEKR